MSIINEISRAIARNPKINRVIVSESERKMISEEFIDLDPRTFGATGEQRRIIMAETVYAEISIMGRPVETRR